MKHLILIPILAPFVMACAPVEPTCGQPNEPVVIGTAKDGNLIYDDQAALSVPCAVVTSSDAQTPTETLTTASTPPTHDKVKSNAGRGNGSEGNPDRDPGNSGGHNKGGD